MTASVMSVILIAIMTVMTDEHDLDVIDDCDDLDCNDDCDEHDCNDDNHATDDDEVKTCQESVFSLQCFSYLSFLICHVSYLS